MFLGNSGFLTQSFNRAFVTQQLFFITNFCLLAYQIAYHDINSSNFLKLINDIIFKEADKKYIIDTFGTVFWSKPESKNGLSFQNSWK